GVVWRRWGGCCTRRSAVRRRAEGTPAAMLSGAERPDLIEHGRCPREATQLGAHWQELLAPCADAFTYPGSQRFTEWLTGLVLNVEEHTITQSLVGLDRPGDWKALESFAGNGVWDQDALERATAELPDAAPGRR